MILQEFRQAAQTAPSTDKIPRSHSAENLLNDTKMVSDCDNIETHQLINSQSL